MLAFSQTFWFGFYKNSIYIYIYIYDSKTIVSPRMLAAELIVITTNIITKVKGFSTRYKLKRAQTPTYLNLLPYKAISLSSLENGSG